MDEYSSDYCKALEAAYGAGMMSEGGPQAIEEMFAGIELSGKSALDFGSGLGGVSQYLAMEHGMRVTGTDINPWMIREATRRIPKGYEPQLDYILAQGQSLPFEDNCFDIVFSKGVLTHLPSKTAIFSEIHRVLKPGGKLVINDWLSPTEGKWGPIIQEMAEAEGLTLYAQTDEQYAHALNQAKFEDIQMRDESDRYTIYNKAIAQELKTIKKQGFKEMFGQDTLDEHAHGYALIAKAIETNELLVRHFTAQKPTSPIKSP